MDNGDTGVSGAVDFDPNAGVDNGGAPGKISEDNIRFHSDTINQNRSADLLLKEEDKKKLKRDEERRAKEEAKKMLREARHKKKEKSHASKEVQEAERALDAEQGRIMADQRRNRRAGFYAKISDALFAGRRKFVTFGIIVVLAVGSLSWYFLFYKPETERMHQVSLYRLDLKAEEKVNIFINEVISDYMSNQLNDGKDIERSLQVFDEKIQSSTREEKVFLYLAKTSFNLAMSEELAMTENEDGTIIVDEKAYKKEIKLLKAIEYLVETDYERINYYSSLFNLYSRIDSETAKNYQNKIESIGDIECKLQLEGCEK